jgi:hypothetical protein
MLTSLEMLGGRVARSLQRANRARVSAALVSFSALKAPADLDLESNIREGR